MLKNFSLEETKSTFVKIGDQFGRLTVIATGERPGYKYYSICQCKCGSAVKCIRSDGLVSGAVKSCGCTRKHGLTKHPMYGRWRHMINRCQNPLNAAYKNYGARGIKVCPEWQTIEGFIAGIPDGYFDGAEIDRIDNDGNYEPSNVRWATRQQNTNNRRTANMLTYNGETKSMTDFSVQTGIPMKTIWDRIEVQKWSVERALETPVMTKSETAANGVKARWNGHVKKGPKTQRKIKQIKYNGRFHTIAELSKICGVSTKNLYRRIFELGWSIDCAIKA